MPTPSSGTPTAPQLPPRTHSSSCPDEIYAPGSWRPEEDGFDMNDDSDEQASSPESSSTPTADTVEYLSGPRSATEESSQSGPGSIIDRAASEETDADSPMYKPMEDIDEAAGGAVAAAVRTRRHVTWCDIDSGATELDRLDNDDAQTPVEQDEYEPPMGFHYSNVRIYPTTPSSYLRAGSRFHGTQQSERQVYDVQVELKYVDLRESFLCGYLKIQGLTEENPTLTTYFEAEIIGSRYDFVTRHEDWGATENDDHSHWSQFTAFRKYSKSIQKGSRMSIPNLSQRENIFMRWKEHFLVPDHRVTSLNGASFEGFYYICFNQKEGSISGIYFHSKSERFQQLELRHVEDRGCFNAIEFR